jgi:hypothetical protein
MADSKETIGFSVEIDGIERNIKSLKDLKKASKDSNDELLRAISVHGENSKEALKAANNVAKLRDKVEDLGDATKSLQGSGIERASAGFSQLGEGLRNLDFDKVKVGLTAMKSALAAVGIGLIVQAVVYLVENFESLSQGSGVLAKSLRFVGDIITSITDAAYKLTDALGLTNSELDKQGEAIKSNADKATEALGRQTAEYDRQIAIAKASGKSAIDLEMAKQRAIIETNKELVKQTIEYVKNGGILSDEQKKLLTGQLEAIKGAVNQEKVIQITHTKDLDTENKKRVADRKKHLDDIAKDEKAAWDLSVQIRMQNAEAQRLDDERLRNEKKAADQAYQAEWMATATAQTEAETNNAAATQTAKTEIRQKELDDFKTNYSAQLDIAKTTADSLQSLSDLYFIVKSRNLQKGTAAELKAAEQQFKINKALAITSAVISGIQGVINALSAQSVIPEPFGTILKVASAVGIGIAAAANVAKIASTKFSVGGGAPSGGGGATSVPVPSPPSLSAPEPAKPQGSNFDENGKKIDTAEKQAPQITVKASIGVDEVSDKTKRVETLEKQATF